MTCNPRATSAEQNSSGQPSICVARPITSSTGGASRSPKRSYATSIPDGPAPRMTSKLIDRASPRFRPRPDPKENLETAAQRGQRLYQMQARGRRRRGRGFRGRVALGPLVPLSEAEHGLRLRSRVVAAPWLSVVAVGHPEDDGGVVFRPEEGVMETVLLDAAGRRRSPATMPGFHSGRPPRNKGLR